MPGELTYEDVLRLALDHNYDPLPMLSVTYQIGSNGGSLIKGQSVKVAPGLRLNAYDTSNA